MDETERYCCDGQCSQGRDCPAPPLIKTARGGEIMMGVLIALFFSAIALVLKVCS